ncbi:coiled-coil domain-containing protein 129 [Python bivittatus]|uniref:Coiled-coil domain-containing protein 129 n=1 Tax=Python bivittatus TaxID=176946 RepID=A0A9F5J128_PYTBI|nr:coiled-coil domain-containing protein 129 [Python bivittatus]
MSSEFHHHGINKTQRKKRELLLSTKLSWTKLDDDFPAPKIAIDCTSTPQLVDHKEENLCNWMNSGFYLGASKRLQESRDKTEALSPPLSMVQMTVQNYMRSLHHFSEMPILSRWNNASSSRSLLSPPKSVTEWLDFSEKDPVEILLDLGFGVEEPDICTKIPSRFISCASMAKGINIRVFIEAQRQRMNVEAPNLYGRFRQLEILDHVTSAFSSLLSNVSTMQQKVEKGKREEKARTDILKGKPQAKKRRIGQLLRKISRQTHGSQAYQNAGICKTPEDHFAAADLHLVTRTGLSDNAALISLKELFPNEEEEEGMIISQSPQFIATKTWGLPHLSLNQPHLPSNSEILSKERPRKEPNLLLTHTLRRLSGFTCKPSDSFEMEEIQSFEDETFWGNPLENTSDAIATRANSCQSDSSGFLEDPLEPLPLQGLPPPITKRFSCHSHDYQEFSQHREECLLMTQDHQSHIEGAVSNISIIDDNTVSLLPSLSEENSLQGEEIFYSINEEDISYDTYSGQSENIVRKAVNVMDENEMHGRRGRQEKEDCISAPERNKFSSFSKKHLTIGSFSTEENSMSPLIRFSGGQNCQVTNVTSECQDANFKDTLRHVDIIASKYEYDSRAASPQVNAISDSCTLQDSSLSPSYFKNRQLGPLDLLPPSTELNKDGYVPDSEINANSFKSVTVQMPSKLISNMQSISLGETAIKNPSMAFSSKMSQCPRNESLVSSVLLESKETKEASAQTSKRQAKKETLPLFHCFPSFHGHGRLVKSASLDTGLYREYRAYCHEPLNTWCAQPMAHCCSLNSHHCCFMRSFPLAPPCKYSMMCWSSPSTIELKLQKTLRLLQDSAVRNISSCTVHEIEVMKNSCWKFQERLDEIEQHLAEQEAFFPNVLLKEGREERQRMQTLRQAVHQEVAKLKCQLQDPACQAMERILMQLDQLLIAQSTLCSELGISDSWEESEDKTGHPFPAFFTRAGCVKDIRHRPPARSATIPSSPSATLARQNELHASALATAKTSLTSVPMELHKNKKEIKGPSQPKIDFKAIIQNLKRSFRSSFNNDAAEGRE